MNETPDDGLSCELHVVSICGPVREENQDAGAAWRGERGELALVVADGMGGHAAGREAAEIVVRSCLEEIRSRDGEDWEATFDRAISAAQEAVLQAARAAPGRQSMGATAAIAVVELGSTSAQLHVAHVGDSRVYLYRGRSLYRLTQDHSLVAQMVRDGLLPEGEAFGHPDSNVIQRAVGQDKPLVPEIQEPTRLEPEDLVLVCSDGLHGALPDDQIGTILARGGAVEQLCRGLLEAALAAGSLDNVTLGIARLVAPRSVRRPTRVPTLNGAAEAPGAGEGRNP